MRRRRAARNLAGLAEAARISRSSGPSLVTRPDRPSGSRGQTRPSRHTDLFPEIIAGAPLLLAHPPGLSLRRNRNGSKVRRLGAGYPRSPPSRARPAVGSAPVRVFGPSEVGSMLSVCVPGQFEMPVTVVRGQDWREGPSPPSAGKLLVKQRDILLTTDTVRRVFI